METAVVAPPNQAVAAVEFADAIYSAATEVWLILKPIHKFAAPGDHPFIDFLTEIFKQLLPLLVGCLPMANPAALMHALKSPTAKQQRQLRFHLLFKINDVRTGNMTLDQVLTAFYKFGRNITEPLATALLADPRTTMFEMQPA